ncbi:MAG: NADPH-dependent FMN reductase [Schleiferiaceae bacterium]
MKIILIQGSPRLGSNSAIVSNYLSNQLAEKHGVETVTVDVQKYNAPNFDLGVDFPEKEELSALLQSADGLMFVVPEYNGRVPGAFKNLMDFFRAEFKMKPMATCTVSGGPFGGLNALHDLRSWMLYVEGIVSPTKLLVSGAGQLFSESGAPNDPHFQKNAPVFLEDFVWLVGKLS